MSDQAMTDQQYAHLVRRLEHEAHADPAAFRRKVMLISGVAYVVLFALLAVLVLLCVLAFGLERSNGGGRSLLLFGLLSLGVLGILFTVVRAFLIRLEPPEGVEITAQDAPALFKVLDKVRAELGGPPLHRVVVDRSFNAAIAQVPRFGLFGGHRNHLVLGLPFLYGMSKREMIATLAHEVGHLAGAHGKLGAWVYRQRITFAALMAKVRGNADDDLVSRILLIALERFAPYFNAYTFVLSRQDEYEADAAASRLVGARANAAGLCRGELLARWLDEIFWPRLFAQARQNASPLFMPYSAMRAAFSASYQDWAVEAWLKDAYGQKSGLHDTHPCLRDRLDAIGERPALPPAPEKSAAEQLLGPLAGSIARQFDAEWWAEEKPEWRKFFRQCSENRNSIERFNDRPLASLRVFELQELARAMLAETRAAEARKVLEHLLGRSDGPFPRARQLYAGILLDAGDEGGLKELERAAAEDARIADECARRGYDYLYAAKGENAAAEWAERLMQAHG